jgi:hypothetical protein
MRMLLMLLHLLDEGALVIYIINPEWSIGK